MRSSTSPNLNAEIEEIAAYTARFPELRQAHHFLFDLRYPATAKPRFVVMGINPGEVENDWRLSAEPTEETSRHDFHRRGEPDGHVPPWVLQARYYLDGAPYVQSELFFWSSKDLAQFELRYDKLHRSPHLAFCRDLNRRLIAAHRPDAVVLPGLGTANLCATLYGLTHIRTVVGHGARLAEVYSDGARPWIFTKHWTGSFGLTREQRAAIRDAIRSVVGEGAPPAGLPAPEPSWSWASAGDDPAAVAAKVREGAAWVQREWRRLRHLLGPHVGSVAEEKSGPGLKLMHGRTGACMARLHPKLGHIAIGLPNSMRDAVAQTGLLRAQRDSAWFNYSAEIDPAVVDRLLLQAAAD